MAKQFSCPACGAPLTIQNRFVKVVTCDFCQQVSLLHDEGLDPTGKTAKLVDLPSALYIDATGTIGERRFTVVGRLRYSYEGGLWDEWFIAFDDGEVGWLVEDEGEFKLYTKESLTAPVPEFEKVAVGTTITVAGREVFVSEKGHAEYAGSEGQLAFAAVPGEKIRYLDGTSAEQLVSLEYAPNEIELSVGNPVSREQLKVD